MIRSRLLTCLPNFALLSVALAVPVCAQSTTSVDVAEDTYLKQGSANKNQGTETSVRLRSSGKNRALLRFDEAALAGALGGGSVTQATLVLTISDNGDNWGSSGRTIDLHRMLQGWTEQGATWNCPDDANTGNSSPDGPQWDMGGESPFAATPTASALISNGQSGEVSFDVTADVLAFLDGSQPGFGWILKKTNEGQSGRIEFSSREGTVKARLDLTYVSNTASSLVLVSGDGQTGTAGEQLAQPFVVEARDAGGNPLQGVAVTFAVTAGNGSLSNLQPQSTGADGRARTTLTLGPAFGGNTVTATAAGLPALSFSASATSRNVEVGPVADTYLKQGSANKNQGAEAFVRLQSSGKNRALLRFDTAAIASAVGSSQLLGATLELVISDNGNNWGSSGRTVDLHRMLTPWTELGATWNCPDDTNTGNSSPDGAQWDMNAESPFAATPLVTTTINSGQSGVVSLDVTAEIQAYLAGSQTNAGWILKKTAEGQNGRIEFHAREESPAPRLVLLLGDSGVDTTPPVLPPLSDLVVEQDSAAGTAVNYVLPPATDNADPAPVTSCTPPPGSVFPPGVTTVTCVATDASGNQSAPSTFTITVQDTTPPVVTPPADLTVEQATPAGTVVTFPDPSASDAVDPAPVVSCTPASGSTFGPGVTTVSCTATDAAGNQSAPVTFTITVQDTLPPTLDQPADLIVEQTSVAGAVVGYPAFVTSDQADPAPVVSCTPTSGSLFPPGPTSVVCAAVDSAGNVSPTRTFTITVQDTLPPSLALTPPDGSVLTTTQVALAADYSDSGSGVDLGSFQAALDSVDVTAQFTVNATQASALSAPLSNGQHTLEVTIADAAGNSLTLSSTFTVSAAAQGAAAFELSLSPGSPGGVPVLTPNALSVRAVDDQNATFTDFVGFVLIGASDGREPLDGLVLEFTAADQGVVTVPDVAFFSTLGTVVVSAVSLEPPPNDASGSLPVNVVLVAPTIYPDPPATTGADRAVVVEGLSFPGQAVELVVNGAVTATSNAGTTGSFTFSVILEPGANQIFVRATDPQTSQLETSQTVTVTAPPPAAVALTATPASLSLNLDEVRGFTVTQSFADGSTADVTATASYSSTDPVIVNTLGGGQVVALNPGTATVTAAVGSLTVNVPVSVAVAALVTTSPLNGEGDVAVTRETVLRFSAPLDVASVSSASVRAEFAGQELTARRHLSPDRKTLTLFYDAPLPASSRVRVSVFGDELLTGGAPIDADGDGVSGGTATIDFDTLSLTLVPDTTVCGRVFASEVLSVPGGGSVNVPLEGATITVDGTGISAVTNSNGDFRIDPAPAGRFFVHIDGRTATVGVPPGAYYPFVGKPFEGVAGKDTPIGDVFLPLVSPGTLTPVSQASDTTIELPTSVVNQYPELAGLQVTVPADSLYADDGTRGGEVGIAPVAPERLPGPLPPELDFSIVITVQTDGATNFDVPVAVRFPNIDNLPPGSKVALWSFNHDSGKWEVVGSMTVSADGLWIETDPGSGILAPGWHGFLQGVSGSGGGIEEIPPFDEVYPQPDDTQEPPFEDGFGDPLCIPQGGCGCQDKTPGSSRGGGPNSVIFNTGEEVFSRVDLAIPGRAGMDFVWKRTYRSQMDYDGPQGFAWTFSYNERLQVQPNGDVLRSNNGMHVDSWVRQPNGSYSSPQGFFSTLIQEPDGTYVLRKPDGMKHFYTSDGLLYCLLDRNGNQLQFDYDAENCLQLVIDSYGRQIEVIQERFPDGRKRITRLRDFIGREVHYTYSTDYDLIEARSPVVVGTSIGNDFPNGRSERYTYSSGFADPRLNHNLLTLTSPEEVALGGPPTKTLTYGTNPADPASFDKVISVLEGGTNASGIPAGGTWTFVYEGGLNPSVPPGNFDVPRGKVTVTERDGSVQESFVDERGYHILTRRFTKGLRAGEPAFYETRYEFNADGRLTKKILPEGNEVRWAYQSGPRAVQGNVIEERHVADATRGGGEDLVSTFSYEPLFNRLASVTDPRGNATGFVPPLGTASPARYTTTFLFDWQEGSDPIAEAVKFGIDVSGYPRNLGDLNGDGVTTQVAGNVVRTQLPSVELRPGSNEAIRLGTTTQEIFSESVWNDHGQPLSTIDAEGNVTDYTYYPENDPDGDGVFTLSTYEPLTNSLNGYLETVVVDARTSPRRSYLGPPAALETRFSYDPVGNVVAVRDPRGVVSEMEVNALNEVVVVTRGTDLSEAVARGQLITGESPLRYQSRVFRDHNGRVVRSEVENRDSTTAGVGAYVERTTTYDLLNNPVTRTAELDGSQTLVWQMRYDPHEMLQQTTQPEGNSSFVEFDERHLVFQATRGFGDPQASTIRVDYDRNDNRVRVVDAEDNDGDTLGEETLFAYDGFDRLVVATDALGNQSLTSYDVASNVLSSEVQGHPANSPGAANVLLKRTLFQHDELSRVYRVDEDLFLSSGFSPVRAVQLLDDDSDGFVTAFFEFDRLSRRTHTVEDDGEVSQVVFDGVSRVIQSLDALGNTVSTVYDRNSNPVEATSFELSPEGLVPAESFTTRMVYDQYNRLVRATDNAGQTSRFAYDSRDNLVFRSDPEGVVIADPLGVFPGQINAPGNTCTWFYDGLDRQVRQLCDLRVGGTGAGALDTSNPTNPDGQISLSYVFDDNSRLVGIVDDNLNRTSFGYDALDRKVSQTNADLTQYTYAYDRDHNLVSVTDPNGSVCTKTYDVLNRLVQADIARAPGVGGTTQETFFYDGLSRMTRSVDNNGAASDQQCDYVYDSLSRLLEEQFNGTPVSNTYTGDGKRLSCVYPGGRVISKTFDAIDRVKSVSDGGGMIATSDWIGPGYRELRRVNGNGTTFTFLNDAGNTDIGYDAVKRITRLRHLLPGGTAFVDREYGYNRASQRTFERRNDDFGQTDSYTYDSMYRVVDSVYDAGGTGGVARDVGAQSYQLDGVGNRRNVEKQTASSGVLSVAHDVNEMNEYTAIGAVARSHSDNGNLLDDGTRLFLFDYKNRLVGVTDKVTSQPVAQYLYYSDNRRAEKTVFATAETTTFFYDGWQVCEETGASAATYVWNPVYIDELVRMDRGGGQFYAHQNARADVVALTDASGAVVEQRFFDDYGQVFDTAKQPTVLSAVGNPYGFQGRRLDPETGLYYFRNRYYSAETGRFVQRDPVWDAANVGGHYSFAGSGPLSGQDAYGLQGGDQQLRMLERLANASGSGPDVNKYARALERRGMNPGTPSLDAGMFDGPRSRRYGEVLADAARHYDSVATVGQGAEKAAAKQVLSDTAKKLTMASRRAKDAFIDRWVRNETKKFPKKILKALTKSGGKGKGLGLLLGAGLFAFGANEAEAATKSTPCPDDPGGSSGGFSDFVADMMIPNTRTGILEGEGGADRIAGDLAMDTIQTLDVNDGLSGSLNDVADYQTGRQGLLATGWDLNKRLWGVNPMNPEANPVFKFTRWLTD